MSTIFFRLIVAPEIDADSSALTSSLTVGIDQSDNFDADDLLANFNTETSGRSAAVIDNNGTSVLAIGAGGSTRTNPLVEFPGFAAGEFDADSVVTITITGEVIRDGSDQDLIFGIQDSDEFMGVFTADGGGFLVADGIVNGSYGIGLGSFGQAEFDRTEFPPNGVPQVDQFLMQLTLNGATDQITLVNGDGVTYNLNSTIGDFLSPEDGFTFFIAPDQGSETYDIVSFDYTVNEASLTDSGTIVFTDTDSESHTASVTDVSFTGNAGDVTPEDAEAFLQLVTATTGGAGTVDWTFTASDSLFRHLTLGELLDINYEITVDDGEGGTDVTTLAITVVGNPPVTGQADGLILEGTAGADTLEGFGGNDLLSGNDGDDTLLGGAGNDIFDIDVDSALSGSGVTITDTITDFEDGVDLIDVLDFGIEDIDAFLAARATEVNGDVRIELANGSATQLLIIENTTLAQLDASDFVQPEAVIEQPATRSFSLDANDLLPLVNNPTVTANVQNINEEDVLQASNGTQNTSFIEVPLTFAGAVDASDQVSITYTFDRQAIVSGDTDNDIFVGVHDGQKQISLFALDQAIAQFFVADFGADNTVVDQAVGNGATLNTLETGGANITANGFTENFKVQISLDGSNDQISISDINGQSLSFSSVIGDYLDPSNGLTFFIAGNFDTIGAPEVYNIVSAGVSVTGGFSANGNDSFIADLFAESFDGGEGNDTVSYVNSTAGVTVSLSNGEVVQTPGTFAASFELSSLLAVNGGDGSNGFILNGTDISDRSGFSVASAGDVNGDGVDDLIIGALNGDPNGQANAGESYVVFGTAGGFAASLNLSSLDGSNGFVLNGIDGDDRSGISVSGAGDINGDGVDDIIIGASRADPNGQGDAGESYVVFGQAGGFAASLDLSALDGSNGFVLNGIDAGDNSGRTVASAGDVNGDGIDDLIIGALNGDPNGQADAGESYVVFGSTTGFAASLELSSLDGSNGFVLNGIDVSDDSGISVSGAGDVNGDGIDDLIIGASGGDRIGGANFGESYVVFGSTAGFAASLDLSALDGSNGFVLNGIDADDISGFSVASAGDVNGDGVDDLIIGARGGDPSANLGEFNDGESYVVFGSTAGFAASLDLSALDGSNGFVLNGIDGGDLSGHSVAGAGDVNGDGIDDLIVGAVNADPNGQIDAGESYVVFGRGTFEAVVNVGGHAEGDVLIDIENLIGSDFNDVLTGNDLNNILDGADGDDMIFGGSGLDELTDGLGSDMLTGGADADIFIIEQEIASGVGTIDTILDFEDDVDTLDLSAFGFADQGSAIATATDIDTDGDEIVDSTQFMLTTGGADTQILVVEGILKADLQNHIDVGEVIS
ncbi:hypothetical protein [Parvularcula sp. IMCC14364]|uniref:beta strand repeat-containing protein n=1 Tax=Parvularcula sp. IMCC14364 TaxID=3067902 RepID=UPI0027409A29|nr:hypothetical protein [Parvularcula sp. IMCC14364]